MTVKLKLRIVGFFELLVDPDDAVEELLEELLPDEPLALLLLPDEPLPPDEPLLDEPEPLLPDAFLLVPAFDFAFVEAPPPWLPPPESAEPLPPVPLACVPLVPEPLWLELELPELPERLAPAAPLLPEVPPTIPIRASTSHRTTLFVELSSVPFSTTYSTTSP